MATSFKEKVIKFVSRIKTGKTLSYKEVAVKAGNSKAARAVGRILNCYYRECEKKKLKRIPCHRVIKSNGEIGGYAKGKRNKKRLLEKEKKL